jgi:hypothetical protein
MIDAFWQHRLVCASNIYALLGKQNFTLKIHFYHINHILVLLEIDRCTPLRCLDSIILKWIIYFRIYEMHRWYIYWMLRITKISEII